jgi:hypothetical protein
MNAIELINGCAEFKKHEARDSMYRVATFLIDHFWGKPHEMSDALGVLLLTWNQAFYRYGSFDFEALEKCLANNWKTIEEFRNHDILDYSPADDWNIESLYSRLLDALQICEKKSKGRKSPVAAVKALHLLAPAFFPLWDDKIAVAYGYRYDYLPFMRKMKELAVILNPEVDVKTEGRSLLKMIDEYNYARYTKKWINP